jgi:hypothetical protein
MVSVMFAITYLLHVHFLAMLAPIYVLIIVQTSINQVYNKMDLFEHMVSLIFAITYLSSSYYSFIYAFEHYAWHQKNKIKSVIKWNLTQLLPID